MLPQRRRARLPGYDYRQNGAYFITVCTLDRAHLFGEIVDGALQFHPVGAAPGGGPQDAVPPRAPTWGRPYEPNSICPHPVGAAPSGGPKTAAPSRAPTWGRPYEPNPGCPHPVGAAPCGGPQDPCGGLQAPEQMLAGWLQKLTQKFSVTLDCYTVMPDHVHFVLFLGGRQIHALPQMLDWYKTMTTNAYIRGVKAGLYKPFQRHVWQRGYYEHVIRNETDLHDIRAYIENNPMKWELTKVRHTI